MSRGRWPWRVHHQCFDGGMSGPLPHEVVASNRLAADPGIDRGECGSAGCRPARLGGGRCEPFIPARNIKCDLHHILSFGVNLAP